MIQTDFGIIDIIRALINVPGVLQYVDSIRPFENQPSDYNDKKKFIVVGFQSGDADDLQRATVNVNAYAPDDMAGNADVAFFRNVETALTSILKDAYSGDAEIDLAATPKVMRDTDVTGYHFMNIRLKIFYPSITI